MILGRDYLALGHKLFPVSSVIKLTPKSWYIGAFDTAFGNALPAFRKCLESGFPGIRSHLFWSDAHLFVPESVIQDRAPRYEKLAKDFPHAKIYVSPSCEFATTDRVLIKKRFDLLKKLAPSCIPVYCSMAGAVPADEIGEQHGDIAMGYGQIVSMDGTDIHDIDVKNWKQVNGETALAFGWYLGDNLKEKGKPSPPPMQRKRIPTDQELIDVINMLRK